MTKLSFLSTPVLLLLLITSNVYSISLGDFNGDGKTDFLAINETWEDPQTLFLSEEQLFSSEEEEEDLQFQIIPTNPEFNLRYDYPLFSVGDFNGDGYSDIIRQRSVPLDPTVTGASLFLSDGNGDFTEHLLPEDLNFDFNRWLYVGDFNGDGKDDLIRDNMNDNYFEILLAVDDQTRFFENVNFFGYSSYLNPFSADFDGDGLDDILIRDVDGFYLYLSYGDGNFNKLSLTDYDIEFPMQIGDFNGDGKADIFGSKQLAPGFFLYLSNGNGTFEVIDLNLELSHAVGRWGVVGDFNGDGKDDIYVRAVHEGEMKQIVYFSNGKGFDEIGSLSTNPENEIYAGDFNGDGLADVLETSIPNENDIIIHLSNSDGTFRKQTIRM